jgi:hypothetical protein
MAGTAGAVTGVMRAVFLASALLVGLAGSQLFFAPDRTDTAFAWTIQPPLTAAALGALYLSVVVLTVLSVLQRTWVNARIFAPGTLAFASLILLATLIHIHRFHWHGPTGYAQFQAYLWITIYAVYPLVLAAAWFHQIRHRAPDPPRRWPLPGWFRTVLGAQAAVFLGLGIALLVAPDATSDAVWPWELTPLTGRAIGAWLVALGIVAGHSVRENDWARIPVAPATYTAVGTLQLVVVARYADDFDWGDWRAWAYAAFFGSVAVMGIAGLVLARQARSAEDAPPLAAPG